MFPLFGYYEYCYKQVLCGHGFLSGMYPGVEFLAYSDFLALEEQPNCFLFFSNCFLKWPHRFTFSPAMYEESSNFPTSSPTLVDIVSVFNFSHLSGCEVVSHFGFDLHFPND